MTSKLDQSLDEILAERPRGSRRGGRGGVSNAPAGGIRKRSQRAAAHRANVAVTQNTSKASGNVPTGPSGKVTASKIIVSNLPFDVSEGMIKEYFTKVVGPIKRCVITYGPNGQSRGIATVEFSRSSDAATAAQKYNGVEVDRRPMKVELVVDPNAPSSNFADRIGPVVQVGVLALGVLAGKRGRLRMSSTLIWPTTSKVAIPETHQPIMLLLKGPKLPMVAILAWTMMFCKSNVVDDKL
ncbi:RNA-binding domain-containing protein [Tuber magnatum]|uniref:RNA-binding domain-containing protein n=1 Tax=Tuber magnatum TaxID=42249 RepID=A0A317SZ65_9PEZI|nr:RNA-binding domain-containing protein [Tuber magnatum]